MKRVSVCMATYNGALFIEEQVKSILDQLSLTDELVVSDDGSSDTTLSIIENLNDSRIRIVPSQRYKSTAKNFENALKYAEGNFIILADQDDIWCPNKVSNVLNILTNYDLVLTDCIVVDSKANIMHESFFKNRNSQLGFWKNLWKNSYMGCCMAFRRDVLEYILPFPQYLYYHDWWIGLMVEIKGKPYLYNKPLIYYRRHGANMTPTGEGSHRWSLRLKHRFWLSWYIFKRIMMPH